MKKIFGWVALLVGMVTGANAQVNDTIRRTTGNDLYQGITRKLPPTCTANVKAGSTWACSRVP